MSDNIVWMRLKNKEELALLYDLLDKSDYEWEIAGVNKVTDVRLGERLLVQIHDSREGQYLYGGVYREWERIKNKVYAFRRKEKQAMEDERKNLIAFNTEELDNILKFQEQEGFNTVQEAIMAAVGSCLKD